MYCGLGLITGDWGLGNSLISYGCLSLQLYGMSWRRVGFWGIFVAILSQGDFVW